MHAGQGARIKGGHAFQRGTCAFCMRIIIQRLTERLAGAQNIGLGQRRIIRAALGEQIAAQ